LVQGRTFVGNHYQDGLFLSLAHILVKRKEPLSGGHTQDRTIQSLQGGWRILLEIGCSVLLTLITGEDTGKEEKENFHIGGLVRIHNGTP
jgi:hypothetical protein